MFNVIFCRGDDIADRRTLSEGHRTLHEARNARVVSGDLVVHAMSGKIVKSETWLWEWERTAPESFARRMQHKA